MAGPMISEPAEILVGPMNLQSKIMAMLFPQSTDGSSEVPSKRSDVRMAGNFAWNLGGVGLPLLGAVIAIPKLYEGIGIERFGILSLAWVVVGYFSLFDLGLGRAITQMIASRLNSDDESQIPSIFRRGMSLMVILGISATILASLLTPWIVVKELNINAALQAETIEVFYLLAVSIPIVIITTGLRGVLEAKERFDAINIVRAPLGILTYMAPLMILQFSNYLPHLVASLVLVRLISLFIYAIMCRRMVPEAQGAGSTEAGLSRKLLSFGGWMTVSNIVGPLLLYLGRLVLAVEDSAEAVAYFSTPYDMVINCLIIPSAITAVIFPIFSQQLMVKDFANDALYKRSQLVAALLMLPICLIIVALAQPAISWWIDPEFSQQSFRVAQILAIGIFINGFGHISASLIQAVGRPDLTAKLHVAELLLYCPYLWWLIQNFGVNGAAIAWVIRVTISTIALWFIAKWCLVNTGAQQEDRKI